MFMHIHIKQKLIFGNIANYLTTTDGITLHFKPKNKNEYQQFSIPYSSASSYFSVIQQVLQVSLFV